MKRGEDPSLQQRLQENEQIADGYVPVPTLEQGGEDLPLQDLKRLGVAEKAGDVDQDIIIQGSTLGGVSLQKLDVAVQCVGLFQKHAPPDPAHDGGVLVMGKVRAGLRSKQGENLPESSVR